MTATIITCIVLIIGGKPVPVCDARACSDARCVTVEAEK